MLIWWYLSRGADLVACPASTVRLSGISASANGAGPDCHEYSVSSINIFKESPFVLGLSVVLLDTSISGAGIFKSALAEMICYISHIATLHFSGRAALDWAYRDA